MLQETYDVRAKWRVVCSPLLTRYTLEPYTNETSGKCPQLDNLHRCGRCVSVQVQHFFRGSVPVQSAGAPWCLVVGDALMTGEVTQIATTCRFMSYHPLGTSHAMNYRWWRGAIINGRRGSEPAISDESVLTPHATTLN